LHVRHRSPDAAHLCPRQNIDLSAREPSTPATGASPLRPCFARWEMYEV
jgi:hypothetical protein